MSDPAQSPSRAGAEDTTVWALCAGCGQRSHISASRCPSCGATLDVPTAPISLADLDDLDDPDDGTSLIRPQAPPTLVTAPPALVTAPPTVVTADGAALIAGLVRDTVVSSVPVVPAAVIPAPPVPPAPVPPAAGHPVSPMPPAPPMSAAPPMPPAPPVSAAPPVPTAPPIQPVAPIRPSPPIPSVDARPYPPTAERSPLVLIGAGVGVGVLLLILGALVTGLFGDRGDEAAAPTGTPVAIPAASITASASSTQEAEGGVTYTAQNTLDGRAETAWNSDGRADGKGPGMVLIYRFSDPVDLTTLTVLNGYQKTVQSNGKTSDLFTLNSRFRSLRVTTDAGSWTWDLPDDRTPQTLTRAFGKTSNVRLEVLSVYPGSKYLDLALSEVSFAARG